MRTIIQYKYKYIHNIIIIIQSFIIIRHNYNLYWSLDPGTPVGMKLLLIVYSLAQLTVWVFCMC